MLPRMSLHAAGDSVRPVQLRTQLWLSAIVRNTTQHRMVQSSWKSSPAWKEITLNPVGKFVFGEAVAAAGCCLGYRFRDIGHVILRSAPPYTEEIRWREIYRI